MRWMKASWLLSIVLAMALWLASPAFPAQAHSNLVRSVPAAGNNLKEFPTTAQLEFSEEVDLNHAQFQLANASGLIVATGTASSSPVNPALLFVAFAPQADGIYSLIWKVQSAVDGHVTSGSIAFSVGLNAPQVSLLPAVGTIDPSSQFPPVTEAILKWLGYLGIALACGSIAFVCLVWRPAFRRSPSDLDAWDAWLSRWLRRMLRLGVALTFLSLVGNIFWLDSQFNPAQAGGDLVSRLADAFAHSGELFWVQLLVLFLLVVLTSFVPRAGRGGLLFWLLAAVLSAGLLLTVSLNGHNAALGNPLAIAGDWFHLAGMAAWLGGLPVLALLLIRQNRLAAGSSAELLIRVVERFSAMALAAVTVVGITGLYSAVLQVQSLAALVETRYGQAILYKIGLFALLIGLGALNQRVWMPKMRSSGLASMVRLSRAVRIETGLGVLLLVGVGALMSLPPAYEALRADYRLGIHAQWQGSAVWMDFRAAPARVGDNEIGVTISDQRQDAQKAPPTMLLRIQTANEDSGVTQVEAIEQGGRYTVRGSYFSRMQPWLVEVIWRKPGFNDVTHTFTVDLARHAAGLGEVVNPIPATNASIAAGQSVYAQNCQICHGASARGDGPLARTMNPAPADLTAHLAPGVHPDGDIFGWISRGYPGSAMPAFKDTLSEQQRWDVLNYLRSLTAPR
jgi:copper transport protein